MVELRWSFDDPYVNNLKQIELDELKRYNFMMQRYEREKYGIPSIKEIKRGNLIDFTQSSIGTYDEHGRLRFEGSQEELSVFYYIPPYKKGAIKFTKNIYYAWEILDYPEDGKKLNIRVDCFSVSSVTNAELLVSAEILFKKPEERMIKIKFLNTLLSYYQLIEDPSIQLSDDTLARLSFFEDREQYSNMVSGFALLISIVNKRIYKHKIHVRKDREAAKRAKTEVYETVEREESERKIRVVGSGDDVIYIYATKNPDKIIRNYVKESWATSGHIRHCKNGQEIYIKPHQNKRHQLIDKTRKEDKNHDVPTTIIVKD